MTTTLATIYYTADIFTPDDSDTNVYGEPTEPGYGQTMESGWYDAAWDQWGVFETRDEVRPATIESDDERFDDGYTLDEIVVQVIESHIGAIDSFDGDTAYASDNRINYTTGVQVRIAAHVTIETSDGTEPDETLDSHTHKFAATWERSRIVGTLTRPCTFPGCRVVTLDPPDDAPKAQWVYRGYVTNHKGSEGTTG